MLEDVDNGLVIGIWVKVGVLLVERISSLILLERRASFCENFWKILMYSRNKFFWSLVLSEDMRKPSSSDVIIYFR